jgi:hypothetical protein
MVAVVLVPVVIPEKGREVAVMELVQTGAFPAPWEIRKYPLVPAKPPGIKAPENWTFPATWRAWVGEVVPIPTLPLVPGIKARLWEAAVVIWLVAPVPEKVIPAPLPVRAMALVTASELVNIPLIPKVVTPETALRLILIPLMVLEVAAVMTPVLLIPKEVPPPTLTPPLCWVYPATPVITWELGRVMVPPSVRFPCILPVPLT